MDPLDCKEIQQRVEIKHLPFWLSTMVENRGGLICRRQGGDVDENTAADTKNEPMGMRQLFDPDTSTCTYLVWDKSTEDAVLIDPVDGESKRDLLVATTTLNLVYVVYTHSDSDVAIQKQIARNISELKKRVPGLKSVMPEGAACGNNIATDEYLSEGDEVHFGNRYVTAIAAPSRCMCYLLDNKKALLTGDTFLGMFTAAVGGCDNRAAVATAGRLGGDVSVSEEDLYDFIKEKLFALDDDCYVLPGHDWSSGDGSVDSGEQVHILTVGEIKATLDGTTKEEFCHRLRITRSSLLSNSSKVENKNDEEQ